MACRVLILLSFLFVPVKLKEPKEALLSVPLSREEYRPDIIQYFRPFKDEMGLARKLVRRCIEQPIRFTDPHDNVHHHWCALRRGTLIAERAQALGANKFYEMFVDALDEAQYTIQRVIELHLAHLRRFVDPIDDAASMDDPDQIVRRLYELRERRRNPEAPFWRMPTDVESIVLRPAHREQNEEFELLRKLAIASQLMSLMIVDPLWATSKDVQRMNEFLRRFVYAPGADSVVIRVHGLIDRKNPRHLLASEGTEVGWALRLARGFAPLEFNPEHVEEVYVDYECRFVPGLKEDDLWLVSSTCRPKELDSALIKLYAGREARDRRGFSHALIARRVSGVWRLCGSSDVEDYLVYLREDLFIAETGLTEEEDTTSPNPDAHPLYETHGRKLFARFHRASYRVPTQPVAVPIEIKVQAVPLAFIEEFATDGMNHSLYKRKRLLKHVVPLWFPKLRRAQAEKRA